MKILYINDKRLDLDTKNVYFPFVYKISDLEDVTIIGTPVSKNVSLPRTPNNDEIFGYIGELTTIRIGNEDNKIGISFKQTKKTKYKLLNDSEVISEGLIVIENVTIDSYECTLYDQIIDAIESLAEINLSEIDIKTVSGITFKTQSTSQQILNLQNNIYVKPVVVNKTYDQDKKKLKCYLKNDISGTKPTDVDLPADCSPLSLRVFKSYDFNYALTINTIINSINETENSNFNTLNYPNIEVDPLLEKLFDNVNLLSNSPVNKGPYITQNFNGTGLVSSNTITIEPKIANEPICNKNGNYYFELPFKITFVDPTHQYNRLTNWVFPGGSSYFSSGTATGQTIGEIYVKLKLNKSGGISYSSKETIVRVPLVNGVNFFYTEIGGNVSNIQILGTLTFAADYYPLLDYSYFNHTDLIAEVTCFDPNNNAYYTKFFDNNTVLVNTFQLYQSKCIYKPNKIRTGDDINALSILPDVSIKNFILYLTKFFNLSIHMNNGNIKISKKSYYKTSNLLYIDEPSTVINTNLITYSKLRLSTGTSESDLLKDYATRFKLNFGEKQLNTGYSIKENEKEIKLDACVPFSLVDANLFAYDKYCNYRNGGFCSVIHGDVTALDNKITFGYLNLITQDIDVVDDTYWETSYVDASGNTIDESFNMWNPNIRYDSGATSNYFEFYRGAILPENSGYSHQLKSYYTFTPYKYDSVNTKVIKESLEMNKPFVNFAYINDDNYPSGSTLYNMYHRKNLIDKLSINTHQLDTKILIEDKVDIYKIYNYRNNNYIISEIKEYDPTEPDMYDVVLTRVNDTENYTRPFADVLGSVNTYNFIIDNSGYTFSATTWRTGGNVLTLGDPTAYEKGIVYSNVNIKPTISDNKVINGSSNVSVGQYLLTLTGLTAFQTYYVRAYLTNRAGTVYGLTKSVTMCGPASLTTNNITYVSGSTAISGLIVSENGNNWTGSNPNYNINTYGICWSYEHTPTVTDNKTIDSNSPAKNTSYNLTMTNLAPLTTFYVRGYVIQFNGDVYYGEEKSFTTSNFATTTTTTQYVAPTTTTTSTTQYVAPTTTTTTTVDYTLFDIDTTGYGSGPDSYRVYGLSATTISGFVSNGPVESYEGSSFPVTNYTSMYQTFKKTMNGIYDLNINIGNTLGVYYKIRVISVNNNFTTKEIEVNDGTGPHTLPNIPCIPGDRIIIQVPLDPNW